MIETAILALGPGAAAGILALGVVLIYRTSGVINFALPVSGTLGTFIAYSLAQGRPFWLAVSTGFLAGSATSLATYAAISFIQSGRRLLAAAIVSGAIAVVLQWVIQVLWKGTYVFPSAFPATLVTFSRWQVPQLYLGELLTGLALVAAISLFLFQTHMTTEISADVDDAARPVHANLTVRAAAAWGAAGALASLSGFFEAQIVFDHTFLLILFPPALLAAALGGLRQIPIAFVGAVALEVAKNIFEIHFVNVPSEYVANAEILLAALAVGFVLWVRRRWLSRLRQLTNPSHLRV